VPHRKPTGDPDWRRIWLAYELLADLRQEAAEVDRDIELEKRIVKRLAELLQDPAAFRDSLQDRLAVARTLAQEGDPRPGVGLRSNSLPGFAVGADSRNGDGAEQWTISRFCGIEVGKRGKT